MKTVNRVIYALIALAVIAMSPAIMRSQFAAVLWFLAVPIGCLAFLESTKTKILSRWDLLLADLRSSVRFLAVLAGYNAVFVCMLAYLMRGSSTGSGISFSFLLGNIVEELFFRATLIPFFELLERRLFDAIDHRRVIAITSLAFGLWHVGPVLGAPTSLIRFVALHNVLFAIVAGLFLGTLFMRSRNLPSVIAVHWWINLQNRVLTLIAFNLIA